MKSGFVSIVGRPNVGKSTLLNAILKSKISIVTNKAQTTRNNIKGIYNEDDVQIVFLDTPGIHKPFYKLGDEMNNMAYKSFKDIDALILVIDASLKFSSGDEFLISHLKIDDDIPIFIVFNKIDLTNVVLVNELKEKYHQYFPKAKIIETVASNDFNVDFLLKEIINILPEGPKYYPDDQLSDRDMRFQAKEIIREKALILLDKEVPHSLAVEIEQYKESKNKTIIDACLILEKDSQKGIVIGKNGQMIKKIGSKARKELEDYLGQHVVLNLYVKVEPDWRNKNNLLKQYGYNKNLN